MTILAIIYTISLVGLVILKAIDCKIDYGWDWKKYAQYEKRSDVIFLLFFLLTPILNTLYLVLVSFFLYLKYTGKDDWFDIT